MNLFAIQPRGKTNDKAIIKKAKKSVADLRDSIKSIPSTGLIGKIKQIETVVENSLGKYKNNYKWLSKDSELAEYIDNAIKDGVIAIDTETSGLDTHNDLLAGLCLRSPSQEAVYVPVGHLSYITEKKLKNQIEEEFAREQIKRLVDNDVKCVFHFYLYDGPVLNNMLGIKVPCYFDTYIAGRILNENEKEHSLKYLYNHYILNGEDKFKFSTLFKDVPFNLIPIETAYKYAAHDAEMTLALYDFYINYLSLDKPECIEANLQGVAEAFWNIEMKVLPVSVDMKIRGIEIDLELAEEAKKQYTNLLKKLEDEYYEEVSVYENQIKKYMKRLDRNEIEYPPNYNSPTQLSTLFYDIIKVGVIDDSKPRGTGKDILKQINLPVSNKILEVKKIYKLLNTFIEPTIETAETHGGKVHCDFNQAGTITFRFSGKNPNLQNIPKKDKYCRRIFYAGENRVLIAADFSQQEMMCVAVKADDEKMLQLFKEGKDIYSGVASVAFNLPYEECVEFDEKGIEQKEGAERRSKSKAIALGICYGKGLTAIARDLNITRAKAEEVYNSVLGAFPKTAEYIKKTQHFVKENGYVTTLYGRKRRLPDIWLPEYEFAENVPEHIKTAYLVALKQVTSFEERDEICTRAKQAGYYIKQNGGFIAQALRQSINSEIQGTAADLTKIAMINIANSEIMNRIGAYIVLTIHDEVIITAPKEHAKVALDELVRCMTTAGERFNMPLRCDTTISTHWKGTPLIINENGELVELK